MRKPTILVIEDNPIVRKLLNVTLGTEGYQTLLADTGKVALEYAKSHKIDLVLQDLNLPDIFGRDLVKKLRHELSITIPIIALSGFFNRLDKPISKDTEFTAILLKPIEPSYLLETVRLYLSPVYPKMQKNKKNKKILLVDDDLTQQKLTSIHLTQAGFDVETAADGEEALKKAKDMLPDAIVSDILMPKIDGFELCLKLRKDRKLKDTPVVLVSSQYLEESDRTLAKNVGANDYVIRTPGSKELIEVVNKNLDKTAPQLSKTIPSKIFVEEHTHRLVRQLERQILMGGNLLRQLSLQGAQLMLLKEVADSITHTRENIDEILTNILAISLDAAGISKGVLYLNENDFLIPKKYIGYEERQLEDLFFGHEELFYRCIHKQEIIQIPSDNVNVKVSIGFLKNANVTNAFIVPLISMTDRIGILLLGATKAELSTKESLTFAAALGSQIGQTIALVQSFDQVSASEKRYRTLMNKASCGILTCNVSGIILEINNQVEILFGCNREEILGKPYSDFALPDDRFFASSLINKVLDEKSIGPYEGRLQRKDGAIRDIEYSVNLVNIGREEVFLVIFNDITERNRLRSQILLNDRLATVGTLAAGIVHEISNPTTWVMENLLTLKEYTSQLCSSLNQLFSKSEADKDSIKELKENIMHYEELIDEAHQGASHIHDLVRNLKGFARIDSDSDLIPVDIHSVLDSALKMAYPEFKYRAKVEKNYSDNLPSLVLNSGKLHQVFLNFLINAAQAITENPRLSTHDNLIRIITSLEKNYVRIDIIDTGIGISEDALPRIFDPFFTTKPTGIGTGLGLPICHEIITGMGGGIEVVSKLGKGSTFTIRLPLTLAEHKMAQVKQNYQTKHDQMSILIVDDEPSLLTTMKRMLEIQHQVTTMLGGKAAINLLDRNAEDFDIIVTDLNMPDVNGMDIYYYVAKNYPGRENRIIFISGGLSSSHRTEKFISSVSNPCINKPFTREDLLKCIDEMYEISSKTDSE